jgi:hypothetical protein
MHYICALQVILQGTSEQTLHPGTLWRDFEFSCKPGDINRYWYHAHCYISS